MSFAFNELPLRLESRYGVGAADAAQLFAETKKMLWLMALHSYEASRGERNLPTEFAIYKAMIPLDLTWHSFLLFSKDYAEFCSHYFGCFLHHSPTTRGQKREPLPVEEKKRQLRLQCDYIIRHLGEPTLKLWFQDLPARHPELMKNKGS